MAETEAVEVMRFQRKEQMDLAAAEQPAEVLRAASVLAAAPES